MQAEEAVYRQADLTDETGNYISAIYFDCTAASCLQQLNSSVKTVHVAGSTFGRQHVAKRDDTSIVFAVGPMKTIPSSAHRLHSTAQSAHVLLGLAHAKCIVCIWSSCRDDVHPNLMMQVPLQG